VAFGAENQIFYVQREGSRFKIMRLGIDDFGSRQEHQVYKHDEEIRSLQYCGPEHMLEGSLEELTQLIMVDKSLDTFHLAQMNEKSNQLNVKK
jgi:hypothetical protein